MNLLVIFHTLSKTAKNHLANPKISKQLQLFAKNHVKCHHLTSGAVQHWFSFLPSCFFLSPIAEARLFPLPSCNSLTKPEHAWAKLPDVWSVTCIFKYWTVIFFILQCSLELAIKKTDFPLFQLCQCCSFGNFWRFVRYRHLLIFDIFKKCVTGYGIAHSLHRGKILLQSCDGAENFSVLWEV